MTTQAPTTPNTSPWVELPITTPTPFSNPSQGVLAESDDKTPYHQLQQQEPPQPPQPFATGPSPNMPQPPPPLPPKAQPAGNIFLAVLECHRNALNLIIGAGLMLIAQGALMGALAVALSRLDMPRHIHRWSTGALVLVVVQTVGEVVTNTFGGHFPPCSFTSITLAQYWTALAYGGLAASGVWALTNRPSPVPLWWEVVLVVDVYCWIFSINVALLTLRLFLLPKRPIRPPAGPWVFAYAWLLLTLPVLYKPCSCGF